MKWDRVFYTFLMDRNLLIIMLAGSFLLLISVFASKVTTRFGIPILLLFIGIGILTGSEGMGGIDFDDPHFTQVLGTISLIYILFSGGLSTLPHVLKPIWREGLTLASVGVVISALVMTVIIHFVTQWSWLLSSLLGAIVSSTDAPAVFGILRMQKVRLKSNVKALIEMESASNDPMAVVLTVLLIQLISDPEGLSGPMILRNFFIQMSLGSLAGWFLGKAMVKIINWLNLDFEGLYPVLTLAGVLGIYSLTEFCGGNGFLSVYLAGFSMAGERFFSKKSLIVFHDGLAWLMQVAMFLTLGLLVNPSELMPIFATGLILAIGLIFLARPISVALCLLPFKNRSWREMWFISWGGLRGAVPIILATYLLVEKVPYAHEMFNIVFFIVIISMILQGFSIGPMGKFSQVHDHGPVSHSSVEEPYEHTNTENKFVEFEVNSESLLVGRAIMDLKLPEETLVVLIHRDHLDFIPRGSTIIEPFDRLVCVVHKNELSQFQRFLNGSFF